MKTKIRIAILLSLIATASFAQKIKLKEVPAAVTAAFKKQYPALNKVEWEKEDGNYEAEFEVNEKDHSELYDAQGNLLETEVEIALSELPKTVTEYVNSKYPGQKLKKADKITDTKGNVSYEAEIKSKDLYFDGNGNFIKEKKD